MESGFHFISTGKRRSHLPPWLAVCLLVVSALECGHCLAETQNKGPTLQADGCANSALGIDISSLGNTDGTPRFKDVSDQRSGGIWKYSYNPCFPFSEGSCSGQAVCQIGYSATKFFQCGDANSAKWTTSPSSRNPVITYVNHGTDIDRTSEVELICSTSVDVPQFVATGDVSNGEYQFKLTTKCACPHACSGFSYSVEVTVSVGWILVIIVLVVAVLYFALGIVFNRFGRQKTGTEMVPNVGFWRALPGLTKDGFFFTISRFPCAKGKQYDRI